MNNYQNNYQGGYQPAQNQPAGALGWDDEIEGGSGEAFTLLPEGDYWFKVKLVEKGWFDGSEKMCAAPKAMVTFEIISGADTVELKENFILHENLKWKIANLYASVGLIAEQGEKVKMNWGAVPNRTGICKITVREYIGTDGQKHKTNSIKNFYPVYSKNLPQIPNPFQNGR